MVMCAPVHVRKGKGVGFVQTSPRWGNSWLWQVGGVWLLEGNEMRYDAHRCS